jgi:hypothetical protein
MKRKQLESGGKKAKGKPPKGVGKGKGLGKKH